MNEDILTAKDLEKFLAKIRNSSEQFNIHFANVGEYDKKQTDLLHDFEFETSYKERNKLSTKMHKLRKDRRYSKDMVEKCDLVTNFTKTDRQIINRLNQLLGEMRKKDTMLKNRTYIRRCKEEVNG